MSTTAAPLSFPLFPICVTIPPLAAYFAALKMEAGYSFEMAPIYHKTRQHISE